MTDLFALSWPLPSLGSALESLALAAGLKPGSTTLAPFTPPAEGEHELNKLSRDLADAGLRLNLEVDHVHISYADAEAMIRGSRPALLRLELNGSSRFLALLRANKKSITLLTPELRRVQVPVAEVLTAFREPKERPHREAVQNLLNATGVPQGRRDAAYRAILRERLGAIQIGGCWILRLSPGRPFLQQLRHEGVTRYFALMVAGYFIQYAALLFGWWLIGRGALSGVTDMGWLLAWALMLYTEIPLKVFGAYAEGMLAAGLGSLLKKRLLFGTLRLDPEVIRLQGAGQLLSRVMESETIEATALAGGFQVVIMVVELSMALFILSKSAAPALLPLILFVWIAIALFICTRHFRARQGWSDQRIAMTHELIEKMVGHRTRLAQQARASWHREEDLELRDYLRSSIEMDRSDTHMNAIVVRGWMVAGTLGIAFSFIAGDSTRTGLAVALGGVLLARNGFLNLSVGFSQIMTAVIAWQRVAPLFHSAREEDETANMLLPAPPKEHRPILEAHNISFHYKNRQDPILAGCDLAIHKGDRLLLQGTSGAGKSTLGSLLTGIRRPDGGLLLYRGLDRDSLGTRTWRKQIVNAPQFHENHVFTETFSFNLLMGRNWPPQPGDLELASEICHDLNLGPLLERMPGGMLQMVGETGWQLSHGERSRLFIARTLLQGADMIVLDESFAALDPENLTLAMNCVRKHAASLLVIAHP